MIRPALLHDRPWIAATLAERWGSTTIVSRGRVHDAEELPALLAEEGGEPCGLATFRVEADQTELVTLDSLAPGRGVGGALLAGVARAATSAGCRRLWLITGNDNVEALRFYQRRGLRLVSIHRGAIDEARKAKPSIPLVGLHGIALHDEIELAGPPRVIVAKSVSVRRTRPGEGPRLRDIRLRALLDAPTAFASSHAREATHPPELWEERAASQGDDSATFVAEDAEGWRGLAGGLRTPGHPGDAHLVGMWVDPRCRGAGVGAALVDAVVGWARAGGAQSVTLWVVDGNEAAASVYGRSGFRPTGEHQPLPSNPETGEQRLRLQL